MATSHNPTQNSNSDVLWHSSQIKFHRKYNPYNLFEIAPLKFTHKSHEISLIHFVPGHQLYQVQYGLCDLESRRPSCVAFRILFGILQDLCSSCCKTSISWHQNSQNHDTPIYGSMIIRPHASVILGHRIACQISKQRDRFPSNRQPPDLTRSHIKTPICLANKGQDKVTIGYKVRDSMTVARLNMCLIWILLNYLLSARILFLRLYIKIVIWRWLRPREREIHFACIPFWHI